MPDWLAALLDGDEWLWLPFEGGSFLRGVWVGACLGFVIIVLGIALAWLIRLVAAGPQP